MPTNWKSEKEILQRSKEKEGPSIMMEGLVCDLD
jgi:hypothetical protein